MLRILIYVIIALVILAVMLRIAVPFISTQPDNLGITDDETLSECSDSPNCVSSFATDAGHRIEPIPFNGSLEETQSKLLATLQEIPRVEIVTADPTYIHAVTRSRIMGYVDDNEFLLDEESGLIHLRAAARLGESDLGANRARIETIRAGYEGR